jgi:spore germination protein KB
MKQNQEQQLGLKEYIAIAIFMVGAKALEETPALLYHATINASWMIPILSGVMFLIPLLLLIKTLSLNKDMNLFAVIQKSFGKYVGSLICLLLWMLNALIISADTRTHVNIIRTYYFTTTPNVVIYAILILVCIYGAKRGIHHVGSVAWIVIFYAMVSFSLALILSTQDGNIQALYPILGPGIPAILKHSVLKTTLFSDFFLLTFLIPYMKSAKEFRKGTWIAYIFVAFQLSISLVVFISLFDTAIAQVGYPFHTAIRYISFGKFLTNIETLFFPIWIMGAFIRFAAHFYLNALMFGHLFKIKDFKYLIPSLATIYLLMGSIPESAIDVSFQWKSNLQLIAGPAIASIAILLWLIATFKGEFKHAKNKNSM